MMTDAMTQAKYRRALVHDLRNLSPEWTWDFGTTKMSRRPCGCAIGRAAALGIIRTAHGVGVWKAMATKLGLSLDQSSPASAPMGLIFTAPSKSRRKWSPTRSTGINIRIRPKHAEQRQTD